MTSIIKFIGTIISYDKDFDRDNSIIREEL